MPVLATDHFSGYRLEREIHRGAQGAVYTAVQQSTGRRVALKVLHEQAFGGPLEQARFEREMRVLAALQHPNIVAIHDGGSHGGRFFLVMDYIAGQPLDAYVAGQPRSVLETIELFVPICEAVNAAHVRGIIHRDIKPANVRVDGAGRPFVLDFGLAKLTDNEPDGSGMAGPSGPARTLTGQFLGSLPWAAPEQAEGSPSRIDIRTDVYALGVLLYQMLTGKFPYPVTGPMKETLDVIVTWPPVPPRSLRREIDDELETIVLKCLHKEPARRYQSAGELARDLARYRAGEPIEAKRDSGWYMLRKGLRRHRLPVGLAAGFVIMLALFGIAMASARLRAEHEADKYRQVLAFLQTMLAGVDPENIGSDDLTVHEILDHAAARVQQELVDQPEVAAPVHQTLGNHYRKLGLYPDAERHLRAAVALRRRLARGDDPDLADALKDLAVVLQDKREFSEAEPAAREALEMRCRIFGAGSLEAAESMHDLACILIDEGYERATATSQPGRVQAEGVLLAEEGRAREAVELAGESLAIRRRLLTDPHDALAASLGNYGWCLMGLGRLDEAETALRDAVEMVRRLPGDHERSLATRLTYLRDLLHTRGDLAGEEAALREAIDIRSRRLAADHPALAWNLVCLAQVHLKRGDFAEAESLCRRALDGYIRRRGPQHEDVADCQQVLAQILDAQGRYGEAEAWWSACLETRRKLLPAEHPDLAIAEVGLIQNRTASNRATPNHAVDRAGGSVAP
ncbi:MAG: serine/threonine protein kinase [Phycisphaerales bacterium]|nr:serine/threonine protein kinase [Phycisphaerales bacterium]